MYSRIINELRMFISRELIDDNETELNATTPLIELGLIDSLSVVLLLTFISDHYGIEVPLEELTEANLKTLQAMSHLLIRLGTEVSPGVWCPMPA